VAVLGLARGAVETAAVDWVTPFGNAMIAGLGLWLVWRGIGGLRRRAGPGPDGTDALPARQGHVHAGPDHHHHRPAGGGGGHVHGPDCGHAHGPTIEEVAGLRGVREGIALVAGIAMRPCSGALFVLILTWQLGIATAGVIGAFVMGLGTAAVTVAVAAMAVWAREGAFAALPQGRVARALPVVEVALGGLIAVAALGLLAQGL
jgi:ABC-type nickel/cobalt efflux system permease component RcnA